MKKIVILNFLFFSCLANAQDDLLSMLSSNEKPIYVSYLFKGTKVVNGQSVESLSKNNNSHSINDTSSQGNQSTVGELGLASGEIILIFIMLTLPMHSPICNLHME